MCHEKHAGFLRSRFEELRPHVCEQASALEEAQKILIECGAVSFCVHELLERYDQAQGLMSALKIERRHVLEKVFEDVSRPALRLLEEAESSL